MYWHRNIISEYTYIEIQLHWTGTNHINTHIKNKSIYNWHLNIYGYTYNWHWTGTIQINIHIEYASIYNWHRTRTTHIVSALCYDICGNTFTYKHLLQYIMVHCKLYNIWYCLKIVISFYAQQVMWFCLERKSNTNTQHWLIMFFLSQKKKKKYS